MLTRRALMRCAAALPLSLIVAGVGASPTRVQLEFHSAFLMNLHHFLYNLGVHPELVEKISWTATPSADEMTALRKAVAHYRDNYAKRSPLFDDQMASIKTALSVADTRREAGGLALPPQLAATLDSVAPMYAHCIWAQQDASNQQWIAEAKRLDARYGVEVQEGIARYLQAPFPLTPIRIDVVVDTGTRQGGYTDTQTVIPSGRPDYQGLASLEMVYHEISHIASTDKLENAIEARLKATQRNPDSDLWHGVQFYTVGTVVKDAYKRDGIAYEPYADKGGLFKGYWSPLLPPIESEWRPYMNGKQTFDQAVARMVDQLPAG
ncbi:MULTISPECIES: hypothetical protein [unclassified Duganella]|uniref:hypothetical protein n=1 Tax=unclassified Duganella TaxID=2636909 RepID=UPI0011C1813A|nr:MULTISPECIES: hypothetical protein [unclassified Duganella]